MNTTALFTPRFTDTLEEILDFVATFPVEEGYQEKQVDEMRVVINNLRKGVHKKEVDFWLELSMYDEKLVGQYGLEKKSGVYWRKWDVWSENKVVSISVKSHFIDEDGYDDEICDWSYYASYHEKVDALTEYGRKDIEWVLQDMKKWEQYPVNAKPHCHIEVWTV